MEQNPIQHLLSSTTQAIRAVAQHQEHHAPQLAPRFSVFDYIDTDELMLSGILRDMLDPKGRHAQGRLFLDGFLGLLQLPDPAREAWLNAREVTLSCEEQTWKSLTRRRMDIYLSIRGPAGQSLGLCIENKPFAADQPRQLEDYAQELDDRHGQSWHLVYLSGSGKQPAVESASPDTIERWELQGQFTLLSYAALTKWLQRCIEPCQSGQVRNFVAALAKYIQQTFEGVRDMTEQNAVVDIATQGGDNLSAALEIALSLPRIQDLMLNRLHQQVERACIQRGWLLDNQRFSRDKKSAIRIQFQSDQHRYSFRIQFMRAECGQMTLGICRYREDIHDSVFAENVFAAINKEPHFKAMRLEQSPWWPFKYVNRELQDWGRHSKPWRMIESGEMCAYIMEEAGRVHRVLVDANLMKSL